MASFCANCGSKDFDVFDGAKFCQQCGSQSQSHSAETGEKEFVVGTTGRHNAMLSLESTQVRDKRTAKYSSKKPSQSQSQTIGVTLSGDGVLSDEKANLTALGTLSQLFGDSFADLAQAASISEELELEKLEKKKRADRDFDTAATTLKVCKGMQTHMKSGLGQDLDRLLTFTKVLRRLTDDLIQMKVLKENCRARVLDLWRSYLNRLGVAFKNYTRATNYEDFDSDFSVSSPTNSSAEEEESGAQKTEFERKVEKAATAFNYWPAFILIAAHQDGSCFLLLSDLIRWIREGKLRVTDEEAVWGLTRRTDNRYGRRKYVDPGIAEHLSICQRTVVFLCHFLAVPRQPTSVDFGEVVSRILWNANLPGAFLHRVHYLASLAPPKSKLEDWRRTPSDYPGNPIHHIMKPNVMLQQLTVETKACAFVLMALKLVLGLDDRFEGVVSERARRLNEDESEGRSESQFVWCNWVKQSLMRRAVRRGQRVEHVLSKGWYDKSELPTNRLARTHRYSHGAMGIPFKRQLGNCGMENFVYDPDNVEVFLEGFGFVPEPDTSSDRRALFAPLVWTAEKHRNFLKDRFDLECSELFLRDFSKDSLDFLENCYEVEQLLSEVDEKLNFKVECVTERPETEKRQRLLRLFPAAWRYKLHSVIAKEAAFLQVYEKGERETYSGSKSGRYNQYKFHKQLEEEFSASFAYLMTFLAEIIGEDRGLLYFVLQCIEEGIFGVSKGEQSWYFDNLGVSQRNIDEILSQL